MKNFGSHRIPTTSAIKQYIYQINVKWIENRPLALTNEDK